MTPRTTPSTMTTNRPATSDILVMKIILVIVLILVIVTKIAPPATLARTRLMSNSHRPDATRQNNFVASGRDVWIRHYPHKSQVISSIGNYTMNTARQIQGLKRLSQSLFSCLSQRSTAAAACGGFAAERCADWIYRPTAVGTQAPSSNGAAANAGSVMWTAELTRLNTDGPCLNRILLAGSSFSQGVVIRQDLFAILVRVCPFRVGLKLQKKELIFMASLRRLNPAAWLKMWWCLTRTFRLNWRSLVLKLALSLKIYNRYIAC